MTKAINIFLLSFYSFGTFCLPFGDFSMLCDLPQMYRHCKETEDKDMTPIDFITDHLVNIDGLFDKHDNGDEQKPHTPFQNHHFAQTSVSFITCFTFLITPFCDIKIKSIIPFDHFLQLDYISKIFHPPIV